MGFVVVGGIILCSGLRRLWGDTEQLAHAHQVAGAPGVGEQAVMADTVEALGQNMDEEAANELMGCQGHDLVAGASFISIVLPFEGDAVVIARDQAAVGDGDAVGVAAEIGKHRFGSGERALGVDHPIDVVQWSEIFCEFSGIGKMAMAV